MTGRDPVDDAVRTLELERIRLVPPPGGLRPTPRWLPPISRARALENHALLAAAIGELDIDVPEPKERP